MESRDIIILKYIFEPKGFQYKYINSLPQFGQYGDVLGKYFKFFLFFFLIFKLRFQALIGGTQTSSI